MTDHLPECWHNPETRAAYVCICDRLRACEQRVRAEQQTDLDHVSYVLGQTNERQRSVLLIADAYAAGVQAAREAVAAVTSQSESWSVSWVWKHDALAAIDALGGSDE